MSRMTSKQLDVLFVNADSSLQAYQGLAKTYSAIEPPTWALLLAQSCRAKGFGVAILDCDAEKLSLSEAVSRIQSANPRLIVFVVYGQNPNSGTTGMIGASALASELKQQHPDLPVCFVGSHTSALADGCPAASVRRFRASERGCVCAAQSSANRSPFRARRL